MKPARGGGASRRSGNASCYIAANIWAASAWSCGGDVVVTLGQAIPVPVFSDAGDVIAAVNGDSADSDPTLTEDMLEIYFTSDRLGPSEVDGTGSGDIWFATRADRTEPFGLPKLVRAANSVSIETSPAISPDGLSLWIGSARQPGLGAIDVWRLTRASREAPWGDLLNVEELNSAADDLPRPLGLGDTVMPLASRRETADEQTYFARRANSSPYAPFDVVERAEILADGSSVADGFLTEDGRFLFFKRAEQDQPGDLYMSWRRSPGDPFEAPIALDAVNTQADERDPWVNADATRFFFASNRRTGTRFDIYATRLSLPRFE